MKEVFIVDGEKFDEVEKQLADAKDEIEIRKEEKKREDEDRANVLLRTKHSTVDRSPRNSEFALVINGLSLVSKPFLHTQCLV